MRLVALALVAIRFVKTNPSDAAHIKSVKLKVSFFEVIRRLFGSSDKD